MEEASRALTKMAASYGLVTGGHLKGPPIDVLFNGKKYIHLKGKRISGSKLQLHGTGCILSSAIAANLAKGISVEKSVENSKKFLEERIKDRIKQA